MEGNYEVHFGSQVSGNVQVTLQGLYYLFQCRCSLSKNAMCRLWVRCGDTWEDLGILAPLGDQFTLEKRIPVKRFGSEIPEFHLKMNKDPQIKQFIPIVPEEPFAYISKLKNAYLVHQNGQAGILI